MKLFRVKSVVFAILLPAFLCADILYKGVCGSYAYDLNLSSNRYYGAFCDSKRLLVYQVKSGADYVRALYTDPTYNSFDVISLNTGRVYKSIDYPADAVKNIGEPSYHFLSGLAGLLIGLAFLYVVMRLS